MNHSKILDNNRKNNPTNDTSRQQGSAKQLIHVPLNAE